MRGSRVVDRMEGGLTKRCATTDAEAVQFMGREVLKQFPGLGFFAGKVTRFDINERLWQVTYVDGDQEELEEGELLPFLTRPATAATQLASTPVEGRQPMARSPPETDEKQLPRVVATAPAFIATAVPAAPPIEKILKNARKTRKKKKSESAGATAAAAVAGPFATWAVMMQRAPCNGRPGNPKEDELGRHATKAEAIAAAKVARNSHPSFKGWAQDYWDEAEPPPYWSGHGQQQAQQNQDEYSMIYIISPEYQKKRAARWAATSKAVQPRAPKPRISLRPASGSEPDSSHLGELCKIP